MHIPSSIYQDFKAWSAYSTNSSTLFIQYTYW